jgi:hypothetical protein
VASPGPDGGATPGRGAQDGRSLTLQTMNFTISRQDGYKVTLLTDWGKTPRPCLPASTLRTPPNCSNESPPVTDQPIVAQTKRIGIVPGQSFDIEKVAPAVKKGLEGAPAAAQQIQPGPRRESANPLWHYTWSDGLSTHPSPLARSYRP